VLTNDQKATLIGLQEYLSRIAHHIIRAHWQEVDPDDLLQEMTLYVAERAQQDPTFLDQAPGYISRAAAWHARHWCRDTFTRVHNGRRVSEGVPFETDGVESRPTDEVYESPEPDNDIAIDVQAALAGLDGVSFRIAQLKMAGMKRKDIATELDTSSQNLSRHLRKIEAALKPVWQAVTNQPEGPRQLSFGL